MKHVSYKPYSCHIHNNQQVKAEAKKKYHHFVTRETSLCRDEIWITWMLNHGCKGFINKPNHNTYEDYVEEKSFLLVLKNLRDELLQKWDEHVNNYPIQKKNLIKITKELADSTPSKNRQEIASHYEQWVEAGYKFCDYVFGAWAVIYHIESKIKTIFPDKIDLITSLEEPIEYLKLQQALFKLKTNAVMEKYGWLKIYGPYDLLYSAKDLQQMKKEINEDHLKKQFSLFSKNKRDFNEFVNTIVNKELQTKVKMMHQYAYLKTDRIDVWRRAMNHLRTFYQYLTTLVPGMTLQDACNLSIEETKQLLERGILPDVKNLRLRSEHKVIYYIHHQKIEIITDPNLIKETIKLLEGELSLVQELKGMVACLGKVKGKVKLINHSNDLEKIEKGDIFVAKYTFPSFTPYMSKSAAIVTDEGGLTSHAAIVSRELRIPCLVGTKIATKVLKDGDLVEVDAIKGFIKILKKK